MAVHRSHARSLRDGHGKAQGLAQHKAQAQAGGLRRDAGHAHERAQMVEVGSLGIGQQALLPGQVEQPVLDAEHIGQGLQKKAHRIAGLEAHAGQPFVCGQDGCLDVGGGQGREDHGRQGAKIDVTGNRHGTPP